MDLEELKALDKQVAHEQRQAQWKQQRGEGGRRWTRKRPRVDCGQDEQEEAGEAGKRGQHGPEGDEEQEDEDLQRRKRMYRDRAKERRIRDGEQRGGGEKAGKAGHEGDGDEQEEARRLESAAESLSAEMSKFLGGDERRTHLVKGLDTLLLEKVRREQQQEQERTNEAAAETEGQEAMAADDNENAQDGPAAQVARWLSTSASGEQGNESGTHPQPQWRQEQERLQALEACRRRLQQSTFSFETGMDSLQDIPTTIMQSRSTTTTNKEGVQQRRTAVFYPRQEIVDLLAAARDERRGKKATKRVASAEGQAAAATTAAAPAPAAEANDEDDIFEGIGEYVPPKESKTVLSIGLASPGAGARAGSRASDSDSGSSSHRRTKHKKHKKHKHKRTTSSK